MWMAYVQSAEGFVIERLKSGISLYTEVLHIYFQYSVYRAVMAENQCDG